VAICRAAKKAISYQGSIAISFVLTEIAVLGRVCTCKVVYLFTNGKEKTKSD